MLGACADHHSIALRADEREFLERADVNHVARHGEALLQRRDEGLTAGQQFRIVGFREKGLRVGERCGADEIELIHGVSPIRQLVSARPGSLPRCGQGSRA